MSTHEKRRIPVLQAA